MLIPLVSPLIVLLRVSASSCFSNFPHLQEHQAPRDGELSRPGGIRKAGTGVDGRECLRGNRRELCKRQLPCPRARISSSSSKVSSSSRGRRGNTSHGRDLAARAAKNRPRSTRACPSLLTASGGSSESKVFTFRACRSDQAARFPCRTRRPRNSGGNGTTSTCKEPHVT